MKKILLLLMVMFTFANYSLAENWVFVYETSQNVEYLDIDSINISKDEIVYTTKSLSKNKSGFVISSHHLDVIQNTIDTSDTVYDSKGILKDGRMHSATVSDSYKHFIEYEYLNSKYSQYMYFKKKDNIELLLKILILLESVLILFVFIFWKKFKKNKIEEVNLDKNEKITEN
ncbi:MAG: hypothetical protein IKJ72_00695 [Mycoplasmataceae bacterium]|nr:hypothetical protein [Mycoplasmataceae bacterium]